MEERASLKQYLIVDAEGKGHMPVRDAPEGPLNLDLMDVAWAVLHGGYRGVRYEGPGKLAAVKKLKALYRAAGMDEPTAPGAEGQTVTLADGQMGSPISGPGWGPSDPGNRGWAGSGDSRFQNGSRPSTIDHRQSRGAAIRNDAC